MTTTAAAVEHGLCGEPPIEQRPTRLDGPLAEAWLTAEELGWLIERHNESARPATSRAGHLSKMRAQLMETAHHRLRATADNKLPGVATVITLKSWSG